MLEKTLIFAEKAVSEAIFARILVGAKWEFTRTKVPLCSGLTTT